MDRIPPPPPPPPFPPFNGDAPSPEEKNSNDVKAKDGKTFTSSSTPPRGSQKVTARSATPVTPEAIVNDKKCAEQNYIREYEENRNLLAQTAFLARIPSLISELETPTDNPSFTIYYNHNGKSVSIIPLEPSLKKDSDDYNDIKVKLLGKFQDIQNKYEKDNEGSHGKALQQQLSDSKGRLDACKQMLGDLGVSTPVLPNKSIMLTFDSLLNAKLNKPAQPQTLSQVPQQGEFVLKPNTLSPATPFVPTREQYFPPKLINELKGPEARNRLNKAPTKPEVTNEASSEPSSEDDS